MWSKASCQEGAQAVSCMSISVLEHVILPKLTQSKGCLAQSLAQHQKLQ